MIRKFYIDLLELSKDPSKWEKCSYTSYTEYSWEGRHLFDDLDITVYSDGSPYPKRPEWKIAVSYRNVKMNVTDEEYKALEAVVGNLNRVMSSADKLAERGINSCHNTMSPLMRIMSLLLQRSGSKPENQPSQTQNDTKQS